MKTLKSVTAVLIILFCTNISAETAFDKNKLDNYLHVLEKNHKAMGGVVISKNGKIVYKNYTGFSSIENKLSNNDKTKFRAASITKMFTSVMIFQLIEEGRLTLDTKLSEFYPDIPNSNEITIEQLLEHRTGIHDFIEDPEFNKFRTSRMTKEKLLKRILKFKSDFKPDEKFKYSNSNFVLLGYIIEDITKSTYSRELKKRITDKLSLKDTAYGGRIDIQNNDAESYRFLNKKWMKQDETDMNCLHGAGGIVSTPNDLAIFISALFDHKLI